MIDFRSMILWLLVALIWQTSHAAFLFTVKPHAREEPHARRPPGNYPDHVVFGRYSKECFLEQGLVTTDIFRLYERYDKAIRKFLHNTKETSPWGVPAAYHEAAEGLNLDEEAKKALEDCLTERGIFDRKY